MQLRLLYFATLSSTNLWVKKHAQELDQKELTRVYTFCQTDPYGRYGRRWVSPPNQSLSCTYFFTLPKNQKDLPSLTQVCALTVRKLLKHYAIDAGIKWPNDLLVKGKKISGVLCELLDLDTQLGVACGIGINVNIDEEILSTIEKKATSFLVELGKSFSLEEIGKKLDMLLIEDLLLYKKQGFAPFFPEYQYHLLYKGEMITIREPGKAFSGAFHSIAPDGRLNLLLPSGEMITLSSGEIS